MNLIGIKRPKWQGTEALSPDKNAIVFDWKRDP